VRSIRTRTQGALERVRTFTQIVLIENGEFCMAA
jgi:hypothetical protein